MQQLINSARFWGLMLSLLFSLHSIARELPDPERVGRQIAERLAERQWDNAQRVSRGEKADYIVDILPEYIADGDRVISIDRIAEDRQKLKEIWNIEATGLLSQLDNLKDSEGKTANCYIVRAGIFNYLNKDDLSVRNWENITPGRAKTSKSGKSITQNYQSFLNHVGAELDRRNRNLDRDAFYSLLFTVFEIDESSGKTRLYHFFAYRGGRFSDQLKPLQERSAELAYNTPNLGANSHINTFSTYFKEALELITGNSYLSNEQYVARLEQQANGSTAVRISLKGIGKGTETDKKELEDQLSQLATEKYNELGETGRTKLVNESQGNMGEFYVKDMNRKEWVGAIGHLGASVWENAALPQDYWNEELGSKTSAIRMPATFVGVSDGVIDEVTSYPQLAKLGYEVASKPEVRNALWESVKGISVETIKDAAIDFYEQKKANYTSDKPYIVQHTVSKDAVQLASIFIGGGAAKGLKNSAEGVEDGVKKVGKEIADKGSELVGKYNWGTAKRYFQHIQDVTGRPVGQKQIDKLKEALRLKEYKKLDKADVDIHRIDFNKKKNSLIKEWEKETGQKWPTYDKPYYTKDGKEFKKIGDPYDAHHIIENQFGGDNEWWNIHPARFPDEHQIGIHGSGSPSKELFK